METRYETLEGMNVQGVLTVSAFAKSQSELETLFVEHHRMVYRAAARITGSPMDAEDVLQTVFLRLAKRGSELDLTPSPASYLHRAAVNAALDIVRSRTRARAVPLDDAETYALPDTGDSVEADQEARQLVEHLRGALLQLSPRTAEMFALRYFEGFDTKEVAAMTGAHHTVVAVLLHRARTRMQKELGQFLRRSV